MPSTTLTDLAPELLIQVLKSSDTFADVTSLRGTSRKIFMIWKTNLGAIREAVLPRTIDCFEQARELLAAQERVGGERHVVHEHQTAMDRVKWMLKGADTAARALGYFEEKVIHNQNRFEFGVYSPKRIPLTPIESTDFIRAYYRAKTLATLAKGPLPCDMLSSWDMLAFKHMKDVMEWLTMGYSYGDPWPTPGGLMLGEDWPTIYYKIKALRSDMISLPSKPSLDDNTIASSTLYSIQFQPMSTSSNRGAQLADLLPLVREQGFHYCHKYYELSDP